MSIALWPGSCIASLSTPLCVNASSTQTSDKRFWLTHQYPKCISSRTVLFTSVPKEYLNKGRIYNFFNGSAKNIWIPGDTKELDRIIKERDKVAMKPKKAEVKWVKLCNKERIKYEKKTGAKVEKAATATSDPESENLVAGWIPDDQRPTHRTGSLGLIGKKVDTIKWGRKELKVLIPKAQSSRENTRNTLLFSSNSPPNMMLSLLFKPPLTTAPFKRLVDSPA
ncbi:hypothetical protein AU210_015671 [Fusarium oxysporum f. sp. radicis-cucumerinum]|uniref:CSC1/OSCA1-like cytosolic domain-containing protein n=1 Tax=Fusarium oxysporum f. sp. radicis-cucumerinum TaxID=327505 RepID=A0A2H3G1U5_FUSOX|nr:hypothetical protein AU210_015671 [Fusarium oxysporum f. sp. radicis-cucumerinum]